MRYIVAVIFALTVFTARSQDTKIVHKVVLKKDSIKFYNVSHAPMEFGESYFVCQENYAYSFTETGFNELVSALKAQSPDIVAFRSPDNKSITCIFPKLATKGIRDLHDFISEHFSDKVMAQVSTQHVVHVQVVSQYDPLNTPAEKGFGYN